MPKTPIDKPRQTNMSANMPANTSPDWWPDAPWVICALGDISENTARGFTLHGATEAERFDIIIWRKADAQGAARLAGFVNKCPHMGLPLETFPDRFLNAAADALICSAHGARFDGEGACFTGPCKGAHLRTLDLHLEAEMIILPPQNCA